MYLPQAARAGPRIKRRVRKKVRQAHCQVNHCRYHRADSAVEKFSHDKSVHSRLLQRLALRLWPLTKVAKAVPWKEKGNGVNA